MNPTLINNANKILMDGLIEKTSEKAWRVKDEDVLLSTQTGHTYLTCSCRSCTFSQGLCKRKIAVILFECKNKRMNEFIEGLIEKYEGWAKGINMMPSKEAIIEDLKLIRYFK